MDPRRRGLGRGLEALIPNVSVLQPHISTGEPSHAKICDIRPNPHQPREVFGEAALEELTSSVREKGLLQPLLVRRLGDGFELIAGERRFRAAQKAGLEQVPIIVRNATDGESLELALIENLQRENLNPIEEARAYQRLGEEFGLRQEEIATRVGKRRSTVANTLRLLLLPEEIRLQIESGALSAGHARSLLGLASAPEQGEAARQIVESQLSVRDTERLVRSKTSPPPADDPDRQALETELTRSLGTRVRVRPGKNGRGKIEIEYYSDDELTGLAHRLVEDAAISSVF